ncbi:hypothetical protein WS86_25180 [Burkholderia savannae]|uniref:hypothetical protein n=1 Tax=Burkholderia savannae TaxID=1637837 RepID=UPI00075C30BF|nr:hypothetical protein [Burkholderia savannae]AOJ83906.1 hypothetical protein WS86_25180 [Burkholderia savannae]
MNGLVPPIVSLPGPAPLDVHLPANALARYCDAAAVVAAARDEARALVDQARRELDAARQAAERVRDDAYREGAARAEAELECRRDTLIDDTVRWLIDAREAEARIAERIDARVRALVASVVEPYLGTHEPVALLAQRVRVRVRADAHGQAFRVFVSPANLPRARDALGHDPRVRIDADTALSDRAARFETPDAIVRFDLDRHLRLLLARLAGPTEETRSDAQPY